MPALPGIGSSGAQRAGTRCAAQGAAAREPRCPHAVAGEEELDVTRALCLVNSLAGLLGLRPSLRSHRADACCPPSTGRARCPSACAVCVHPVPGLELLVVPSPAEMAAWGPAPQEGLQLVRSPLAPALPPVLAALLAVLALLVLALLLGRLFFLLGEQHGVAKVPGQSPHPQAPGRGVPPCLSSSSSSSPWREACPPYLQRNPASAPPQPAPPPPACLRD